MSRRKWFVILFVVLSFLLLGLTALPGRVATAAPSAPTAADCRPAKIINGLLNEHQLEAFGLHRDIFGSGSLAFHREGQARYASLSVAPDGSESPSLIAARITEVDTSLTPHERTKCWQPTPDFNIEASYTIRFEQAVRPPGLTETVFLWNSPFGETSLPLTAIGVTRIQQDPTDPTSSIYVATIAQGVTFGPNDFIVVKPMPDWDWLDPTEWHTVHVQLKEQEATISVVQDGRRETVLSDALPQPLEPLAFEASVDNEVFPGFYAPVPVADTIDVATVSVRQTRNR